jgi:hypothetical protein
VTSAKSGSSYQHDPTAVANPAGTGSVKPVDVRIVFIIIAIIILVGKGVLIRIGTWSGSQWMRFMLQLAICASLAAVPFVAPQQGLNPNWTPAARLVYVVTEFALMLYGILSGAWLLRAFAGDAPPPRLVNGMLFAFIALLLAFAGAAWLEHAAGIPYQQTGAVILGFFCVWIGATLPEWVERHMMYTWISGIITETGTRLSYAAVGFVLIGFGLLGRAHIFR